MEWGYEEKFDILGIILKDKFEFDHSVEIKENFIIDVDKENEVAQIQIVDWAKMFKIPKPQVRLMKINVDIQGGRYCYKITVKGELRDEKYEISGEVYL